MDQVGTYAHHLEGVQPANIRCQRTAHKAPGPTAVSLGAPRSSCNSQSETRECY